jgi:hypothetical protein
MEKTERPGRLVVLARYLLGDDLDRTRPVMYPDTVPVMIDGREIGQAHMVYDPEFGNNEPAFVFETHDAIAQSAHESGHYRPQLDEIEDAVHRYQLKAIILHSEPAPAA